MWRLVYSVRKLSVRNRRILQSKLDEYAFSCGAELSDLELGEEFLKCMFNNSCYDPIECLHYSAGYPPICVYCGEEQTESDINPQLNPQCKNCEHKPPVK